MAITYTEIKEQKNTRIWIFYTVVIVFYFLIAVLIAGLVKGLLIPGLSDSGSQAAAKIFPLLTVEEVIYILFLALVAAVIHVMYSLSHAISFVEQNLDAQDVDSTDSYHSRFAAIVDEVNVATGNKYKVTPVVIPTTAMNAFAICNHRREATLGATEGLLSKLNRQQLEAVVAHEFGHIVSGDSFQTTIACALFGIYAAILVGIRKTMGGRSSMRGRAAAGILVIFIVLNIAQFFYNIIKLFVSRDRELRADAIAVQLTRDPVSLSQALYAISHGWRGLGHIEPTLESLFIMNPVKDDVDEKSGFLPDLFSTHPPVAKRMAILAALAHEDVENIEAGMRAQEQAKERSRDMSGISGGISIAHEKSVLKCPKCSHFLNIEDYEGLRTYHCPSCDGYLVYENKMPRLIIREEKGFGPRIEKMAELMQKDGRMKLMLPEAQRAATPYKCPKCNAHFVKGFYTSSYLVEVERCFSCGLIWFDKDELDITQYLIENKKTA